MAHTLPNLNYDYNALEPHYDEKTLKIHHDIHHKAYVDGLNKAEQKLEEVRESGDFTLIKTLGKGNSFSWIRAYFTYIILGKYDP